MAILDEAVGAFVLCPFEGMVSLACVFVQRYRVAAGGLHFFDIGDDDLAGCGMKLAE